MKKWIKFIYGKYAKLRLDRKIAILYMLLILVLSVTLTVLITHTAGTILIRDRKNSVRRNVNVAKEFIETELNGILSAGLSITMSNGIQEYYSSQTKDEQALKNINMLIQMAMDGNSEIELITLFDNEQTNLYTKASQARYKAEEDIQRYYEDAIPTHYYNTRIYYSNTISTSKRDSLIIYFPIYSTERLNLQYGILAISFRFDMPRQMTAPENDLNYALSLIDREGIFFLTETGEIGTKAEFLEKVQDEEAVLVNKGIMYVMTPLDRWELSLIGQVEMGDIDHTYIQLILMASGIVAILLAAALAAGRKILKVLYSPMNELLRAMDRIDSDNLGYRLTVKPGAGDDQIKIREGFNSMMQRLQDAMETIQSKQAMIEKLRFEALQSQIQPHFLYNTLECIHWQAAAEGNREVSTMIKALAKFYRIVLSSGEDVIPLSQELDHVRSYVTIQNLRYDNIVDLQIQIPEHLLHYRLPKITLQPLVENAIYHGIRIKEGNRGTIRIYARENSQFLELVVGNSGTLSVRELERINSLLVERNVSEGYGINNVNKRLQIEFGMQYGLRYEVADGTSERAMAIITLPLKKD